MCLAVVMCCTRKFLIMTNQTNFSVFIHLASIVVSRYTLRSICVRCTLILAFFSCSDICSVLMLGLDTGWLVTKLSNVHPAAKQLYTDCPINILLSIKRSLYLLLEQNVPRSGSVDIILLAMYHFVAWCLF